MSASGNHNLLFGALALRLDFITQNQFVDAVHAWSLQRDRSLAEILVERGALSVAAAQLLTPVVELHLARHGGDEAKCLTALGTVAPIEQALSAIRSVNLPTSPASANMPETLTDPDATAPSPAGRAGRDTMRLGDACQSDVLSAPQGGTRYAIERTHARGGLGEVFVALDVELNRKVALKQIREQHADDPVSRSQFLVEGEITGGLEHPGIIPVYGLGRYANGRPYYAMRFVKGDTLQTAIESFHDAAGSMRTSDRNLRFRELLRRFLDVCQTMAYAHQRGVLHRDLKPGNVLLGAFGETLVIDWGLAKVLGKTSRAPSSSEAHTPGTMQPVTTSHEALETVGRGVHGTPGYMSPEQVSGDIDVLGPATDIYSLGAILYHLLTNRPPLRPADGDVLALTLRGGFPTARQVNPDAPSGLDAICRKAMALKPGDRYASVQQLREDVDHWLADEPVSAWSEPVGVKARRWIRKHPRRVAALTATVLMATIGVGVGTLLLGEKNRALTQALSGEQQERQRADDRTRLANERFTIALDAFKKQVFDTEQLLVGRPGMQELRKAMLAQALDGLQKLIREAEETEGADRVRAWAHFALGDVSLSLEGQLEKAHQEYQKAFELCQRLVDPKDAQSQRDLSIAHDKMGKVLYRLGDLPGSLEHYQESMTIARELADGDPNERLRQRELAIAHDQIGNILSRQGQVQKSLEHYQESMTIRKRLRDPGDARSQRDLALSFDQVGDILFRQEQLDRALEQYQESMRIRKQLADEKSSQSQRELSASHDRIGNVLYHQGKLDRALEEYQESLALVNRLVDADPKNAEVQRYLAIAHTQVGDVLLRQGQLDKAQEEFTRSMTIARRLADADPSDASGQRSLSIAYDKLGHVLLKQGEPEKALEPYQQSMQIARRLADAAPKDAQAQRDLAIAYDQIGKVQAGLKLYPKALEQYQQSLKILKALAKADDRDIRARHDLALGHERVGETLLKQGEAAKAAEHFLEGLAMRKRLASPEDAAAQRGLSIAHDKLGLVFLKQGELTRAMEQYEASMAIAKRLAEASPSDAVLQRDLAIAYDQIGDVLLQQRQGKKAAEQYEGALRIRQALADLAPSDLSAQWLVYQSLDVLGDVWSGVGEQARAAEWYEKALAVLRPFEKAGKLKDAKYASALKLTEEAVGDCRTAEKALGSLDTLLKLPESEAVKLLLVRADWLMRQGKQTDAVTAADRLTNLAKNGDSLFAAARAHAWCTRDRINEDRHATRSIELLRKAHVGGHFKDADSVKSLRSDRAFSPLLKREDFKKLLAELEMKRE